jgi:hypothetical protein
MVETWTLSSREGDNLQVFENKELKKSFGPKKDDVSERFRTLHIEEFHNMNYTYRSRNPAIRIVKSGKLHGTGRFGRSTLTRTRRKWKDNVKFNL